MADLSVLKNIVRTGRVSSVNAGNRTARVTFEDKGQSPLVSGELKVIKNPRSFRQRERHRGRRAKAAEAVKPPLPPIRTPSK